MQIVPSCYDASAGDVGDVEVARRVGHDDVGVATDVDDQRGDRCLARLGVAQDFGRRLLMDISDQKRAEAQAEQMKALLEERVERRSLALAETADQLKETEQTFRLLVQSVTDYAIFMLDPEGHIANWNAGAERITQ